MATTAATTAAIAAAAAEAARRREEEEMTKYGEPELRDGWEFKILRANSDAFKKPDVLRQVCEEEAQAGWVLLEKFDDSRLRFKRPISERQRDNSLAIDPYRTHYGMSQGAFVAVILGVISGALLLVVLLVMFIVRG
ncbi:MAG: hypothetical protein M3407_04260 [Acidobacteriota bacterium]|jgi:hypothetical protein|nr:hypothetical protein [Acidobacteriota bacterium]